MIKLKNVSKIYYNKGVIGTGFSKVSLEFNIGEFIAIVGESGSGKSTLLNVISGLDTYEEGEMYINGEETSHYNEEDFEEYRRKYVANIFQGFNLVNSYTVRQNVELVLLIHGIKSKEAQEKVDQIIKDVGLWEYRNKRVSKLSGGQKQRVAIARALAKETPIIVADEPTGNLDQESSKQIIELLHKISKNKLVIIVTHNYDTVEKYVTRVIRMHDGKVVEDKNIKDYKKGTLESNEHFKMSLTSKAKLAFRNAFNIVGKLLLILGVFIMCVSGILTNIGGQIKGKYDTINQGISYVFSNQNPKRIIIRHKDGSQITENEYENIRKLSSIDEVINNDIKLDSYISLFREKDDIYLDTAVSNIKDLDAKIYKGRMPEKDNEVVLMAYKDDFYIKLFADDFLEKDIYPIDDMYNKFNIPIKIVGIALTEELTVNYKIFANNKLVDDLGDIATIKYGNATITINNTSHDNSEEGILVLNDKVPAGAIYINEALNHECKNNNCLSTDVKINVKNIYTDRTENFKVTDTITKKNCKTLLGISDYDDTFGIYMNIDDYNRLNNTDNYQSGVIVKDIDQVDNTVKTLEDMGFQVLAIKNSVDFDGSDLSKLVDLFNIIGSVITLIVLYFISYFVIFLVLKSRNTYFAVVRILGGTVKVCRELINLELFIQSTISFLIVLVLGYLFKFNIIQYDILSGFMEYLKWYHFVIGYFVSILMSQLIARRFSKKIFKDSMITTYNMEV